MLNRIGNIIVKTVFSLAVIGAIGLPFFTGGVKEPGNPLSHKKVTKTDNFIEEIVTYSDEVIIDPPNVIEFIPQFIETPEGGTPWDVFTETIEHEYEYGEDPEFVYMGVRPEFSEDIKKLDGQEILIQGYMFPLGQEEKQAMFLLGPFPVTCPYHYHVPPKLIIEVHTEVPMAFSYDAIDIKGTLELVPDDKEYNVFYRLKNAKLVP